METFMKSVNSFRSQITYGKINIDNGVFRLHYRLTVFMLVGCAGILSIQLLGKPIDCSVDKAFDEANGKIMNTFCWIQSTFTIPNLISDDNIAWAKAHPGVRPRIELEDDEQYHKYYQWVVFVLIFQAFLFYIPYYIWSNIEGGKIEMMVQDLNQNDLEIDGTQLWEREAVVNYFINSLSENQGYLIWFIICEILNFINVILQIFFTDMFLGYEFTKYGTEVLNFVEMDYGKRTDPMDKIFPKVTKCTFNKYGPSGGIINFDGICILPLNVYNEKIYVFLWFWFIILAIISGIGLIYRLITILVSPCRLNLLKNSVTLMSSRGRSKNDEEKLQSNYATIINETCKTGDWFLFYQLGKNINSVIFRSIVTDVAKKIIKSYRLNE